MSGKVLSKESLEIVKQASKEVQALINIGVPYCDKRISAIFDKQDKQIAKIEGV